MSSITSRSSASPWKRFISVLPSASTTTIFTIDLVNIHGAHYILTFFNKLQNKSMTVKASVSKRNGQAVKSIYDKLGDSVNISIDVSTAGVFTITNNGAFDLNLDGAYLNQGG